MTTTTNNPSLTQSTATSATTHTAKGPLVLNKRPFFPFVISFFLITCDYPSTSCSLKNPYNYLHFILSLFVSFISSSPVARHRCRHIVSIITILVPNPFSFNKDWYPFSFSLIQVCCIIPETFPSSHHYLSFYLSLCSLLSILFFSSVKL